MDELLRVETSRDGEICTVSPIGEVDMQTMRPLRELVRRLPDEGVRFIVFDLRGVGFMDSAGMSVLFAARKMMAEAHGGCYVVSSEQSGVRRALETIQIERVMPHLSDLEGAYADIRQLLAPAVAA